MREEKAVRGWRACKVGIGDEGRECSAWLARLGALNGRPLHSVHALPSSPFSLLPTFGSPLHSVHALPSSLFSLLSTFGSPLHSVHALPSSPFSLLPTFGSPLHSVHALPSSFSLLPPPYFWKPTAQCPRTTLFLLSSPSSLLLEAHCKVSTHYPLLPSPYSLLPPLLHQSCETVAVVEGGGFAD